ncbi:MAG TPA: GNAT family N-acetyltransferase [Bacillota bacterium]|nr:GNAT family N-acetyltransferase [Bacillota bacterium]
MHIRKAQLTDAYDLAVVHVASWRTTYQGIIDEAYLSAMSVEDKLNQWEMILRDGDVFVVENEEGKIIGFGGVGPERTGSFTGYDAEVYAIYLLYPYQGKGIGRALLKRLAEFLLDEEYTSLLIWVLAENPSVHFYKAMGGTKIGEERIQIGEQFLIEHAYGWKDLRFV